VAWAFEIQRQTALLVILASWALALFEYLFQVPANRTAAHFTLAQLKVMQECITIFVFTIIVWLVFRQVPRWNNIVSFLLIVRPFISPSISKSEDVGDKELSR